MGSNPCGLWSVGLLLAIGMICLAGCGYPAVEPVNQELITSLRTACSTSNSEWLEANVRRIEAQHTAGQMREDEYRAFMSIVERARGGDWEGAARACLAFQKAQQPTPEQIEKIRTFHEK